MLFTQVKLQASDPERLARFYEEALDCEVVLPLVRLEEPAWEAVGAPSSDVQIMVLSLPGVDGGPTLELITGTGIEGADGMLTFYVEDVDQAAKRVVRAGGAYRGVISEFVGPSGDPFRFVFMTDPEGNVIDLFTRAR